MTDLPLYTGIGGDWHPHAPYLDALISKRLHALGFQGTKVGKTSLHATPTYKQALNYARGGCPTYVRSVSIAPGSLISWAHSVQDMLLDLQSTLQEEWWSGNTRNCPILADTHGDVDTLETYLSLGRQQRRISGHIDRYLRTLDLHEVRFEDHHTLANLLGDHRGEVWVTGSWTLCAHAPQPLAWVA